MAILNSVVKNRFGKYYKLQLSRDTNAQLTLKSETFWNEASTRQFIQNLTVPHGYWREIVKEYSTLPDTSVLTTEEIEQQVSSLMVQDQFKLYSVEVPDIADHPPENRVIKSADDIIYRFIPTSSLLLLKNATVKQFKNIDDAKSFITELSPPPDKLKSIASELKIAIPNTASVNKDEVLIAISTALVAGGVVVIADKISTPPAMDSKFIEAKNTIGNKKADLGPHESEEKPTHWFAIKLVNESDELYKNESFTINLSDKSKEKINKGNTNYRKEQLPSGKCTVKFSGFYKQIEEWFKERSH